MTQEEKVKVYLEDLRKAKDLIEKIFTELKEREGDSEDERVRKAILSFIKQSAGTQELTTKEYSKWIEYLEKQKVITEGDFGRGYDCGYQAGYDVAVNEMKPKVAMATLDSEKQKPAEWSKNDTVFLNEIINFFEDKTARLQHDLEMYAHWLKSLPKRFNLQPKNEWSEEDEEMFDEALTGILLAKNRMNDTGCIRLAERFEKAYKWLESFRPRLHLKPNDVQILYKEMCRGIEHSLATEFINYLDNNKPEGKMCLSNGECEDIDKAFKENDWAKIIRYVKKYHQSEQKPEVKLTRWVARDENGEIYAYEDYPEKDSEMWIGSNSMLLDRKSFPDLKWENEPMEVEVTIKRK